MSGINGGLDLKSLETNPNYKPETQPVEPAPVAEPVVQTGTQPVVDNVADPVSASIDNSTGSEPASAVAQPDSSLTSNNNEPAAQVQQPTEESIFQTLSEKLDREITSFDDLVHTPEVIDPAVKELNDWSKTTGKSMQDFFKYQKDYSSLSDEEVAREFLQEKYPTFTDSEISLELQRYKASEEDLDQDKAMKNLELKKLATEGRNLFNGFKKELSQPSNPSLTPEVQAQLDFAQQVQAQQIAQKETNDKYSQGIIEASMSTESMKLQLSDDLALDFKMSEQDRKDLPQFINEMPHWRDENGEWNHQAVAQDGIKIKYFDKLIKLAYEQGLNSGVANLEKEVKNTTLDNPNVASQPNTGSKKPQYSDTVDKLLGTQSVKFRQ